MAWCDVMEPRTLREFRVALGKSQAAFAAMLGVSAESYRTWDAGRRATPPQVMARARALATHRDDHALLPLPVLALLIGVHVKTLQAAARDGRLPVTYDNKTNLSPPPGSRDSCRCSGVSVIVLWANDQHIPGFPITTQRPYPSSAATWCAAQLLRSSGLRRRPIHGTLRSAVSHMRCERPQDYRQPPHTE